MKAARLIVIQAIDYIWNKLVDSLFTKSSSNVLRRLEAIHRAVQHRCEMMTMMVVRLRG